MLHGAWLDAAVEPDELHAGIAALLAKSPTARQTGLPAEEWAFHDFDGFGPYRVDEYESIETITAIANGINTHGLAYAGFAATIGDRPYDLALFEDTYLGQWASIEAYAEDLIDSAGIEAELDRVIGGWIRPYVKIDIPQLAHDISLDLTAIDSPDGHVWLFNH